MNRGIVETAAAMKSLEQRLDFATDNLVHAHVAGFKSRSAPPQSFDSELRRSHLKQAAANPIVDFSPGNILADDGNPLSTAIQGEGFFSIQTPAGEQFSRAGDFTLGADGRVATRAGYAVLGEAGPIQVTPNGGPVSIGAGGVVRQGDTEIGRLRITDFTDKSKLVPTSATMFRAGAGAGAKVVASPQLVPGHLEYPQNDTVTGLVDMISIHRQYESTSRAMQTIADSIQQRIRSAQG